MHLEKMKCALKTESLPCSRQPLMELYASPPLENQGALPGCCIIFFNPFILMPYI